jgi:hypothetical protein
VIPVTRFPFINMLYSLLSDPNLVMDLSNLDVNSNNPFGKYKSKGNYPTTTINLEPSINKHTTSCKDPYKFLYYSLVLLVKKEN